MRRGASGAGQIAVSQPASRNLRQNFVEPLTIVLIDAVIESEHLLIEVAVKMERLHGNVGSGEIPFRETPEVFKAVGMNLPPNVVVNVVDRFMNIAIL